MAEFELSERPWERQAGETGKAYDAFIVYRDLGRTRTLTEAVKRIGKNRSLIDRWKAKYRWNERVIAYDNDLERSAHETAVQNYTDMLQRHIKIALSLNGVAMKALKGMNDNQARLDKMSAKDIAAFVQLAEKIERGAMAHFVQQSIPEDGAITDTEDLFPTDFPDFEA